MARLTSGGQGAAAWIATLRLLRSYLARTSSGSLSIRKNIVGTHWEWVARYFSMSCREYSGSNFGITTTVPPWDWVSMTKRSGAAWYSGAGER